MTVDEAAREVERALAKALRRGARVARRAVVWWHEQEQLRTAVKELQAQTRMPQKDVLWAAALPFLLGFNLALSRLFPPLTAVFSGSQLYTSAWFSYSSSTKFDDSILTWGTDYLIALVMGVFTILICMAKGPRNGALVVASALLIGSYNLSTFAGAIAHQFLSTALNTINFRVVWSVCVTCVAAAGGFMGAAASEIAKLQTPPLSLALEPPAQDPDQQENEKSSKSKQVNYVLPVIPHFVWISYSTFLSFLNLVGFYSMKRPACDIFLVGVTQAFPTAYLVLALFAQKSWKHLGLTKWTRRIFVVGALLNIVLLPAYDLFAFLQLPLGVVNLILHTTLLLSWGSQAFGLLAFCRVLQKRP